MGDLAELAAEEPYTGKSINIETIQRCLPVFSQYLDFSDITSRIQFSHPLKDFQEGANRQVTLMTRCFYESHNQGAY